VQALLFEVARLRDGGRTAGMAGDDSNSVDRAVQFTLESEGVFSNDKNDAGGERNGE